MEIYNERVRDLITGKTNLEVRETKDKGLHIPELSSFVC